MYKQSLAALCVIASLAGCSSNTTVQNPVDFVTYRDAPLVKQVEKGMTMQQVLAIGGTPSTVVAGTANSAYGTCNNYILNREGHQQPYYVSFDSSGRVATKGFMTCEQRKLNETAP
ncbi:MULTISPECIES: osmotically-inducible lipoprotein OsmE [Pseudomonas]|jgi:osmotically inducible lipoprotein OsmE|uniref:Osmotically-inducible lipoprotein OsmE n=1 Tax=Pseudomonas coleopterorum TaxID=1605838 RepID=A0AAJ6MTA8_9PSED|nr:MULTISPECIES: osmotically-inducible lipoprotein OsmE [Pseudomonas]RZA26600.1 MAG: osmotically-inducible lipoprotein OsmE [Pseudomonadota bacterium]KNC06760.1 transcriptional regulator [Pseudomonas sp. RIT-PI-a]KQQ59123.1 transcriptional regulator [Pseudomonas sp. Leaf129]MBD8482091.1 osmotically-inducible lipoprotein OsmE [Pseudomonas coleopterorum]MBD8756551.1 osmotically-inducible lipoprotein OsmE [Pseudomonas coleopterorum]